MRVCTMKSPQNPDPEDPNSNAYNAINDPLTPPVS